MGFRTCIGMLQKMSFSIHIYASRITIAGAFLFSMPGYAAQETSNSAKINYFDAYAAYGNGDVVLKTDAPGAVCIGYWISPSNPGAKNVVAMLTAAFFAGKNVRITGETSQIWPGSSSKFCSIYNVFLNN